MPCPRDGCTSPAFVTPDDGFDTDAGEYLWECAVGHHGPRLVLNTRLLVEQAVPGADRWVEGLRMNPPA